MSQPSLPHRKRNLEEALLVTTTTDADPRMEQDGMNDVSNDDEEARRHPDDVGPPPPSTTSQLPFLPIRKLQLEAIFYPKFDNETLPHIRRVMMERCCQHEGYLEVTLKHSGSLLLWSGARGMTTDCNCPYL